LRGSAFGACDACAWCEASSVPFAVVLWWRDAVGQADEPHNKGMKLTRVGAGARRSRRVETPPKVAAQLMPGVGRRMKHDGGWA